MELKLGSVTDFLNEQEWFQQIRVKWEELDPQSRLYLKVAGLVAGVLIFLYLIFSSLWGIHSLKRDLADKNDLLALIDNSNEEVRRLHDIGGSIPPSDATTTPWPEYFESIAASSSIDKGILTVSAGKPGTGGELAKEDLFDLSLKKANIRQVIKLAFNLENGARSVKVRSISVDTAADPSGYLDATLSVSAFTVAPTKAGK